MSLSKNDLVRYWKNKKEYRGRAIGVELTEKGTLISVENIDTHQMDILDYERLEKLHKLTDFDRECMMSIEEFIDCVECGCITDWDGSGNYSDGEYRYESVDFYPDILRDMSKKYKYVCWYNK